MRWRFLLVFALGVTLNAWGGDAGAGLTGPGPWFGRIFVWGNDTGGIIPYSPEALRIYRTLAAEHCASFGRLSHITSVHRKYGDYIGFVCIDRPGMIH